MNTASRDDGATRVLLRVRNTADALAPSPLGGERYVGGRGKPVLVLGGGVNGRGALRRGVDPHLALHRAEHGLCDARRGHAEGAPD
jgi:hypothetical protein